MQLTTLSIRNSVEDADFMKAVTNPSFSFTGATGDVRLDSNNDRISNGISLIYESTNRGKCTSCQYH